MLMAKTEERGRDAEMYLDECARTNRQVMVAIVVMLALLAAGIHLAMKLLG